MFLVFLWVHACGIAPKHESWMAFDAEVVFAGMQLKPGSHIRLAQRIVAGFGLSGHVLGRGDRSEHQASEGENSQFHGSGEQGFEILILEIDVSDASFHNAVDCEVWSKRAIHKSADRSRQHPSELSGNEEVAKFPPRTAQGWPADTDQPRALPLTAITAQPRTCAPSPL